MRLGRFLIQRKIITSFSLFIFLTSNGIFPLRYVCGQELFQLPQPGDRVNLSSAFESPVLRGIKVFSDNPFRFDFIFDQGADQGSPAQLKIEATRFIKYFLAGLTIPEQDLWVNLSPYEKDQIVSDAFGRTEMGRDLLSQDYLLKQITASVIYPESIVGQEFWGKVYAEAARRYGTIDVPVDTFNKVWIVPEKAIVYESPASSNRQATAFVVKSRLKVMLESDYLAESKTLGSSDNVKAEGPELLARNSTRELSKQILREIIIPILEREVNEGKNFAPLRQVYNSLILATWYKRVIKRSVMQSTYIDQKKIAGVSVDDPVVAQKIWDRYVQAFRQGVYNLIKEEYDPISQTDIPRKYFSGGIVMSWSGQDMAMTQDKDSVLQFFSKPLQIVRTELNNLPISEANVKVDVVYDTLDEAAVLKFSKLKNGSGVITRQFGEDMVRRIKNAFGAQIASAPGEWGIISIGSSQFLGEVVAKSLGLPRAHIRGDDFSLFKVRNFVAAKTLEERKNILYAKHFTLENRRNFKAKNVILVDDMLNRGVTLTKGKEFLEEQHGLHVMGSYVLFSIADLEDASVEARINMAFIDTEGMQALIKMINGEEVFVTRHLLKSLFYEKGRLRNLLALDAGKRMAVLSKGFIYISAKAWGLMKAKTVITANRVSGGISDFVVKSVRRSRILWDRLTEDFMEADLRLVYSEIEKMFVNDQMPPVVVPVAKRGKEAGLPFDAARPFRAVLLDFDGTLSGRALNRIVRLLEKGYKVGIVSGRDEENLRKVIIDRVLRRLTNRRLADSLYIFEEGGSSGYRVSDGKVLIFRQMMNKNDRQEIFRRLEEGLLSSSRWSGARITFSPSVISINVLSKVERLNIIQSLLKNMSDWGLEEKYSVFDTGVNIHIVPERVSKGVVADVFAAELALQQEEVLKVGNMYGVLGNDYPMLSKPGGVGVDSPVDTLWLMDLLLRQHASSERSDRAQSAVGGIDLNSTEDKLEVRNTGDWIAFDMDPALLKKAQDAAGFFPVITDIFPLNSLPQFLGINTSGSS